MTTAARPTWDTAKGGSGTRERDLSALSKQYSSRDLPSHTTLKSRDRGQNSQDELRGRDLKRELEEREKVAARERRGERAAVQYDDQREVPPPTSSSSSSKRAIEAPTQAPQPSKKSRSEANLDADDPVDSGSENEDSDESDDDDDDTAALMAELQKIKEEKAAEEREREDERRAEEEQIRMENILTGNPLLKDKYGEAGKADMKVKRRWDDDVVFKNCSRAEPEKQEKRFINDSLRSDFHRKFMDKYIK